LSGFNTAIGSYALPNSNGTNTAIGFEAFTSLLNGTRNVGVGYRVGRNANNASDNAAFGNESLSKCTASYNACFGNKSLQNTTYGSNNTAGGYIALLNNTTGAGNSAIGNYALGGNVSGHNNTAIGKNCMNLNTTYSNCSGLGHHAQVNGPNEVQLGDSATTTYAFGSVQDRSDERDKADIRDTHLGLNFINKLRPVDFKWDYRADYKDEDSPGSKKRSRFHHGVIAQEVKQVMDEAGIDFGGFQDHAVNGGNDVLTIGYTEFIAPLIGAVKELSSKLDRMEARLSALESN